MQSTVRPKERSPMAVRRPSRSRPVGSPSARAADGRPELSSAALKAFAAEVAAERATDQLITLGKSGKSAVETLRRAG